MTRGTILVVGPRKREYDLFLARLEKDGFAVERKTKFADVGKWLRNDWPQAVLFAVENRPQLVRDIIRVMSSRKQKLPFILMGIDDVPAEMARVKGVAETFLLHSLAVSHALRRLTLGIKLCQIRPSDYI